MTDLNIPAKVNEAIEGNSLDGLVAFGADNVHYLSGAYLPFLYHYENRTAAVIWPNSAEPIVVCPVEWESSIRNLGWIGNIQTYEGDSGPEVIETLAQLISEEFGKDARLGVDKSRIPHGLFSTLTDSLKTMQLISGDELLRELRMVKTTAEVGLLEDVAYSADHAIVAAAHHILIDSSGQSKSEVGYRHDIIVHAMERYIDLIGHHSIAQVLSGSNSKQFWSLFGKPWLPERGTGWLRSMKEGDLIRAELRASKGGYWSDAARMLTVGEADAGVLDAYHELVQLKRRVMELLRAGEKCSGIFTEVEREAENKGVELIGELGIGHGIGVSTYEPPYLTRSDHTILKAGMVVVLDPVVKAPKGEIIRSKDTLLIGDQGCDVLGQYVNWDEPHLPAHLSSRSLSLVVRD
jgi:Xaa-Pro dipeptidase